MITAEDEVWLRTAAYVQALADYRRSRQLSKPRTVKMSYALKHPLNNRLGGDGPRPIEETAARVRVPVGRGATTIAEARFRVEDIERWARRKHWRWRCANPTASHGEIAAQVFEALVDEYTAEFKAKHALTTGAR